MRCAMLLVLSLSGCALISRGPTQPVRITTSPPGAAIVIAGKPAGTTPLVAEIPRNALDGLVLIEARAPGYDPSCLLLIGRVNTAMATLDSIPAAIPLAFDMPSGRLIEYDTSVNIELAPASGGSVAIPSEPEVRAAYAEQRNPCDRRFARYASVIVTAGDLSRAYEILGDVRVDTTGESGAGAKMADVVVRGPVLSSISPTMKGDAAKMLGSLKMRAVELYGAKVDAIINANTYEAEHDVFASGVAVHFVEHATGAEPKRTVSERLDELDHLGASGAITPAEYRERRKAILGDL